MSSTSRHSEDGETIRTVRCGLDVEDMIVEAEMRDEVRAERRVAVEDEDPRLVLQAESQLALRAQHPLGFHPSDRRGPDAAVSREDGARRGEGGTHADLGVGSSADHGELLAPGGGTAEDRKSTRL